MKNIQLLLLAQGCYGALATFRRDRLRNKRYHYGDQWSDVIDVDGHLMTEEDFITSQGSVPLKNNLIRRLVRNVIGVYGMQGRRPVCMTPAAHGKGASTILNKLLNHNSDVNRLSAVLTRSLEEFLISGMVVHRKWYGRRGRRNDCWTDMVAPNNFFVDSNMRDIRAWDCRCVGEIHDIDFGMAAAQFAHDDASMQRLRRIYAEAADPSALAASLGEFGAAEHFQQSFLMPRNPGLCRVIELWRKETVPYYHCYDSATGRYSDIATTDYKERVADVNARRKKHKVSAQWMVDERWRYYFLAPNGEVLAQGDSPYAHGGHPYVMKAYPMIDGEIHSFVGDVIDQQRYTNRLITMYDWIVRSSAKGVLMVPEDCIPRGATPSDFADAWSRFDGVLVYRPSPQGNVPKQVSTNSTNIGITELLNLQLGFFEDISGVHSALQGKVANAGMSAAMYGQQTHNATATLLDILDSFSEFVRDGAYMDIRNICQFYDQERISAIVGKECKLPLDDCEQWSIRITNTNPASNSRPQ